MRSGPARRGTKNGWPMDSNASRWSGSARNRSKGRDLPLDDSMATSRQKDLRRMSNDCAVDLVLVRANGRCGSSPRAAPGTARTRSTMSSGTSTGALTPDIWRDVEEAWCLRRLTGGMFLGVLLISWTHFHASFADVPSSLFRRSVQSVGIGPYAGLFLRGSSASSRLASERRHSLNVVPPTARTTMATNSPIPPPASQWSAQPPATTNPTTNPTTRVMA